ncbi:hypothetical protein [Bradyrhizobium sp. McL0615]|uniref:hypothetical protein n=1 Tax=Bradyrhizobium sp. McL0615 TaxID=3415673 RepID=UPI003CE8CAC6
MPAKKIQKLWDEHLVALARKNMAKSSIAPKINHADPDNSFELVVTLIPMGDEDDKFLQDQFHDANLNIEDPFHWWQLLHDSLMMIRKGRPGPQPMTQDEKDEVMQQCIAAGIALDTTSIAQICRHLVAERIRGEIAENLQYKITRSGLTKPIQDAISQRNKR